MIATCKKLCGADLFCGAGGFTTGAERSGRVRIVMAVNHWRTAVFSHRENHPHTRHICARIDDVDPRNDRTLPEIDVLLASPECTHHSNARGGRPIDDQKRATPWHVPVWAEAKRPQWIIVENVREFLNWGPLTKAGRPDKRCKGETFRAWVKALESLGYQVDWQLLNAADFGAPTRRVRLFVIARRGRSRRDIPWPEPTHAGRWRGAWEILDWSKPCPSIFTRKRPLAEKTLRRIEIGLRKFVEPFIVKLRKRETVAGIDQPLNTITAGCEHFALAAPFLTRFHNGPDGPQRSYSIADPLGTLDTQNRHGLVFPFLIQYYGEGGGQVASVVDPLSTVTARHRHGLALVETMRELGVADIGFRMLDVNELLAAQGFDRDYYLHGNKAERVRQVGNSVSPPVAEALCRTVAEH